jgi:hypothetical protein
VSTTQWGIDDDEPRRGDITSAVLASTVLCRNARPFWSTRTVRYPAEMLAPGWVDDLGPCADADAPDPEFRTLPALGPALELERGELPRLERLAAVTRVDAHRAINRYRATMLADRLGTDPEPDDVVVDFAAQSGRALVATLLCYGALAVPGTVVDTLSLLAAASDVVRATDPEALVEQCYRVVAAADGDELIAWLRRFVKASSSTTTTIVDAFALARMAITRHISCVDEERVSEQSWHQSMTRAWEERQGTPPPPSSSVAARSLSGAAAGDPNVLNIDAIAIGEKSKFWRERNANLQ